MNKTNSAPRTYGPAGRHIALLPGLMLTLFLLVPNSPRPSVAFPVLLGAVSLYYFHNVKRNLGDALRGTEERWFLATLFGFTGYLFLNSLWALATPAALEAYGAEVILGCLMRLQAAAARHEGIDYLQVYEPVPKNSREPLWFIEDDEGGAITALLPSDY